VSNQRGAGVAGGARDQNRVSECLEL
jgi:hypothetical protein